MRNVAIRRWSAIHKWTSLVCTAFLLMLCITGLPLIFHDELEAWFSPGPVLPTVPKGASRTSVDGALEAALARHPSEVVTSIGLDDESPAYSVAMLPRDRLASGDFRNLQFDARTGALIDDRRVSEAASDPLVVIDQLHSQMYAGLPGRLFLGAMAILFIVAIVSGIILYGPFTRRIAFGNVRLERGRCVRWLDLHNLLGIVVAAWSIVIGLTGALNTISQPLYAAWQSTAMPALIAKGDGSDGAQTHISPEQAIAAAEKRRPGYRVRSIFMPSDPRFGSPGHYLVWLNGKTVLTARLYDPVLIDSGSGAIVESIRAPWYLRALDVSRPLHFGDYGGLPLKVIWAMLDLVTIVVLGSGLYLWIAGRRRGRVTPVREVLGGASPIAEPSE